MTQDDVTAAIAALVDKLGSVEVTMGVLPTPAVLVRDGFLAGVILDRDSSCCEWAVGLADLLTHL